MKRPKYQIELPGGSGFPAECGTKLEVVSSGFNTKAAIEMAAKAEASLPDQGNKHLHGMRYAMINKP
jgi:hypothetical protein